MGAQEPLIPNTSVRMTQQETLLAKGKLSQGASIPCLSQHVVGLGLECLQPGFGPRYLRSCLLKLMISKPAGFRET